MSDMIHKSDALALFDGPDKCPIQFDYGEARDRIAALPAVTVGVKPLVWESDGPDALTAQDYRIVADGHWFRCFGPHEIRKRPEYYPWPTLDAAKAAAQADYEARILAALEPVAAPDNQKGGDAFDENPIDARSDTSPAVTGGAQPDPAAIREAALREAAAVAQRYAETDYCAMGYPEDGGIAASGTAHTIQHDILALIPKGAAE